MKQPLLILFLTAALTTAQAQSPVLIDINPGGASSFAENMTSANNNLFIRTHLNQGELWKTDGTQAGTEILRNDIDPDAYPGNYVVINGKMIFTAYEGVANNLEPWVTDGTSAGTMKLKEICPGPAGSYPYGYHNINGKIIFAATDTTFSMGSIFIQTCGVWVTDGTPAGTEELVQMDAIYDNGNTTGVQPSNFFVYNNKAYFMMSDTGKVADIWVSDGTVSGTKRLMNTPVHGYYYDGFIELNSELYILSMVDTNQGFTAVIGGLWHVDVNAPSTSLITNFAPYGNPTGIEINGKIFFYGSDGGTDEALWVTDGTAPGTHLVKDINIGANSSDMNTFTAFNNKLYFFADDVTGKALWVSDGTTNGTMKIKQLALNELYARDMIEYAGNLYFSTYRSNDTTLAFWYSNGNAQNATMFAAEIEQGGGGSFRIMNGSLYFGAYLDNNGAELWKLTVNPNGIPELQKALPLTVFPNPATDELSFSTTGIDVVTIYNIAGEKLSEIKQPLNNKVDVNLLTPGIYIAEVKQGDAITRLRWVKM